MLPKMPMNFLSNPIFFFNFLFDFFNDPGYLVTYFPTSMCFCVLWCIFLLLIYNKKNAWYGLNFPKFTEICSVAHHVIYPAECLICTWEECVFCCFWIESSIKYQLSLSSLMCHLRPVFSYWFFPPNDLSIDVTEVLKSPTFIVLLFLLLWLLESALYIEALLCWEHLYIQLLYLILWLIPWSLCSFLLCLL